MPKSNGRSSRSHSRSNPADRSATIAAVDRASAGAGTASRRISCPSTPTASSTGLVVNGVDNRSSNIAPASRSASYSNTIPRPSHHRSARTCSPTSGPGGFIRSTNCPTGTTIAFDP
jgi:hypothetical protein